MQKHIEAVHLKYSMHSGFYHSFAFLRDNIISQRAIIVSLIWSANRETVAAFQFSQNVYILRGFSIILTYLTNYFGWTYIQNITIYIRSVSRFQATM